MSTNFGPTNARDAGFRMPAEWEPHSCCWMAWPDSLAVWDRHLPNAQQDYARVANAIADFEPVRMLVPPRAAAQARNLCTKAVEIIPWDLDDAWMRDMGPNFLKNGSGELAASLFLFNAWGQKYEHFRKDAVLGRQLAESLGIRTFSSPIFMEGGGINVDGEGTLLTTEQCILHPNRNPGIRRNEAEEELCRALGVSKVIWLKGHPEDQETDGHIDGLACFTRPGVVLAEIDPDQSPGHSQDVVEENISILRSATDARGRPLEVHLLPVSSGVESLGDRFWPSAINFYIANGGIVMPAYGVAGDEQTREIVSRAFPDREVVPVAINHVAFGGGGIHCITQQQPA